MASGRQILPNDTQCCPENVLFCSTEAAQEDTFNAMIECSYLD